MRFDINDDIKIPGRSTRQSDLSLSSEFKPGAIIDASWNLDA